MKEKMEIKEGQRPGKPGGYSHVILDAKQVKKRKEAEERQAAYNSLTIEQKIAHAKKQRGESRRQLKRMMKSKNELKKVMVSPNPKPVESTEELPKKVSRYRKYRKVFPNSNPN